MPENALMIKVQEYFALGEKRKERLNKTKQQFLTKKQQKDEERINKMLEQNIIDDIGVNFLFHRGTGLKDCLIDIDRAYRIIEKIDNTFKESQLKVNKKADKGKHF